MPAVALTVNTADYTKVEKAGSGNTLTVPVPANARVGDVLVATFASDFNGGVTTDTPGWVRITPAKDATFREAAVFHAFTTDGVPAAPVFTQTGATVIRATGAMYRVTGASQTERATGTAQKATGEQAANTRTVSIPATGAAVSGLSVVVAYNNATAANGGATLAADVKVNGNTATSHMTSYGTGSAAAGSSSTNSAVYFSATPGPFTVDWGKTIANSSGVAVTIPAADGGSAPVDPEPQPEPEHDDEPGVTIQVGPGNVTTAAANPSTGNALVLPVPSRARPGDVLLAAITHSGSTSVSVDASWTLLSNARPTGSTNRWLAVYGYHVTNTLPAPPGVVFTAGETNPRMSGVMLRLTGTTGVGYLKQAGTWQVTEAEDNRTAYTIPAMAAPNGAVSGKEITLAVGYTNTTAGNAPALTTVANGVLVAHAYAQTAGAATTTLSVWRHHSGVNKDVTIAPAAANAAGFQLTFREKAPVVPASWEVRVMQDGKLVPGTVAATRQGNTWPPVAMVSWQPKDYTLDDLFSTDPFFIAHRGSGDTWPEHTMESYNNSTAYGVKALELSVQLTADNILICHHDLNFMKTAKDPRTVRSMTYQQILDEIRIDTRQWTGLSSTLAPPPLAKDVVDAFIDTHVIFIEDKGGDGANILLNLMDSYPRGKDKFVWKQWAGAGQWRAAKERGYKLWGYFMADIFARIPELAPNFDYLGIPHTASDQVVSEIVQVGNAMGVPVIMWEIHYRWMFERAKALGVKGMMTSCIPYVMTTPSAQFTEDQWHTGLRPAGDLPQTTDAGWGVQPAIDPANGGVCRYEERANGAMTLGSMGPVLNTNYRIEWEMRYLGPMPTDVSHAGLFTGHDEDRSHRTGATSPAGGYHIIQRVNGLFDLYRHDPNSGAGIPLGTAQAARPVAGQWMRFQVDMTDFGVTATRLDGTPITLTSPDTLYRGGYFGVQKNYTTPADMPLQPVEFRSVKVVPLGPNGQPIATPL